MPQGNDFWNPYRWVPITSEPVRHAEPVYHHRWTGLAGRIESRLTALTPFLINDGTHHFVKSKLTQKWMIPSTSFKGLIRSLVEVIGNAAQPFLRADIDPGHMLERAAAEVQGRQRLDVAARMFGYLHHGNVFAGLVRFSDGSWPAGQSAQALPFKICGGTPKPTHTPFYLDRKRRKFYHHKTAATSLTGPHPGIPQAHIRTVYPLPPGVRFDFNVDFVNLGDEELRLLLYCLFLEESVTVTLSPAALGPGFLEPVPLAGPMRHKFGYAKSQGAGSVSIEPVRLTLHSDPAARYRDGPPRAQVLEGEPLNVEIVRRTVPIRARKDVTMETLRAMLIYAPGDPRAENLNYPSYMWFQTDKETSAATPLKPTL